MNCAVDDCAKPRKGTGPMCSMHETRVRTHGDVLGDTPALPPLPSSPLVELVERRGGCQAVTNNDRDRRNYTRAKEKGVITVWSADVLANRLLDLHPAEVWGEAWWFSTGKSYECGAIDPQAARGSVSA